MPIFRGNEKKNPYSHIKDVEEIFFTFQEANIMLIEVLKMKVFLFTLIDKAKIWFNTLRPQNIIRYTNLQSIFL